MEVTFRRQTFPDLDDSVISSPVYAIEVENLQCFHQGLSQSVATDLAAS